MKKRAALARYFQNHKEAIYASRATRFRRYEQEEMEKLTPEMRSELIGVGRITSSNKLGNAEVLGIRVRETIRLRYNFHPRPWDTRCGRPVYIFGRGGKAELVNSERWREKEAQRFQREVEAAQRVEFGWKRDAQ